MCNLMLLVSQILFIFIYLFFSGEKMVEWGFMDAQAFCDCGECLKNFKELLVFFLGNFISFAASLNEV